MLRGRMENLRALLVRGNPSLMDKKGLAFPVRAHSHTQSL